MPRTKIIEYIPKQLNDQKQGEQEEKRAEEKKRAEERKKINDQKQGEQEEKRAEESDKSFEQVSTQVVTLLETKIDVVTKTKEEEALMKQLTKNMKKNTDTALKIIEEQRKSQDPIETFQKLQELDENLKQEEKKAETLFKKLEEKNVQQKVETYKQTLQEFTGVCNDSSFSDEQKNECKKKVVQTLLLLRQEIYKKDAQLSYEFDDEKSILNKSNLVQTYSKLFASNLDCDDAMRDDNETKYFRCLVEKGMMFASILYAKQVASKKDKDIQLICDLLISETTEKRNVYLFSTNLQYCLAKIQLKLFQKDYTLNNSEELLLQLMRQVPVVKALNGEDSRPYDELIAAIYETVNLLKNNNQIIKTGMKKGNVDTKDLRLAFAKHEESWIGWIPIINYVFTALIFCLIFYYGSEIDNVLKKNIRQQYIDEAYTFIDPVANVIHTVEKYDKILLQTCGAFATYGFVQAIINPIVTTPIVSFFYMKGQQKLEALSQPLNEAQLYIKRQRKSFQKVGAFNIIGAFTAVVFLYKVQAAKDHMFEKNLTTVIAGTASVLGGLIAGPLYGFTLAAAGVVGTTHQKKKYQTNKMFSNVVSRLILNSLGFVFNVLNINTKDEINLASQTLDTADKYIEEATNFLNKIMLGGDDKVLKDLSISFAKQYLKRDQLSLMDNERPLILTDKDMQYFLQDKEIKKLLDKRSEIVNKLTNLVRQKSLQNMKPLKQFLNRVSKNLQNNDNDKDANLEFKRLNLIRMFNSKTSNLFKDHLKF